MYGNETCNSFFQTLLGVIAFLFGLRDRGFDLLNSFGIQCSVDQVRKHGKFWSEKRNATDELKMHFGGFHSTI